LIGYYEPHINSWDCLAGLIMVDEAGGATNDFLSGEGLLKGNPIIVSASGIKDSLRQMINQLSV
jgi:myo-inositol-1(or 4)-monophosphatase